MKAKITKHFSNNYFGWTLKLSKRLVANLIFFFIFSFFLDFGFIPDLGKTNFRTFEVPRGSTKQHDIYSFGIIVQEGINESYGGGFNCSKFDPWISDLGDLLSARTIFHGI